MQKIPNFFASFKSSALNGSNSAAIRFASHTKPLEIIKGNPKFDFQTVIPVHIDGLDKLRYDHLLRFKGAVVVKISPAFQLLKFGLLLCGAFHLTLHIGFLRFNLLRKLCDFFFAFCNKAVQQVNIQAAFTANDVDRFGLIVRKLLLLFLQPHGRHFVAASGKRCGLFVLLGIRLSLAETWILES